MAATLLLDKNDRQIGSDTLGDLNDYSTGRGREHEKPNPHAKEHKELLAKLVRCFFYFLVARSSLILLFYVL